jgi:purine-binding chemotaxis protein CheW
MEQVYTERLVKYLVFKAGNGEYALNISDIQAIIKKDIKISRVPGTPAFIKGVINLRGEIVPVMSLGLKLCLQETFNTEETRIVIIKEDDISLGLIVDCVSGVAELSEESIQNIGSQDEKVQADCVKGLVKIDERVISILNTKEILNVNK